MVKVTHRNMQKYPAGNKTPIKVRKCDFCDEIFMSERGLAYHQSLKKNINCHRAGMNRKRKDWSLEKLKSQKDCNKRTFENHDSLFVKHPKGKPFSSDVKQVCLNVYQDLRNRGWTKASSIGKAFKILTFARCLEITEKVSFNIASKASYVIMDKIGGFLKTLPSCQTGLPDRLV